MFTNNSNKIVTFLCEFPSNQCKLVYSTCSMFEMKGGIRSMDPSEKRKLARKAIRKNPDAYGALITEYKEYLYKMAYLYMKNEQDALDIVGTTILKGFQNIHTLKNPDWFKTWITKILIRTAQDELKKVIYFDSTDESRFPSGTTAFRWKKSTICTLPSTNSPNVTRP